MCPKEYNVAIAGVTGAVGKVFLSILEERDFPVKNLIPLASHRSKGRKILFKGEEFEVQELKNDSFSGMDIALFSAGALTSKEFAKFAVDSGAVVIDNSSAFRMEEDVPLVVPEINREKIFEHNGIIANPNCSTIVLVVALKPIYDISPIKRIVVSTYQAVSGAGAKAILELENQTREIICERKKDVESKVFPVQIAFNVVPHVDIFLDNGYTKEEMKMVHETRKIFNDNNIMISATTVRVPVFTSHSEAVFVETKEKIELEKVMDAFANGRGLVLKDDFRNAVYPTTLDSSGGDDIYVGRVREDISVENGICMWVVGDQLRKGAALNTIQIAEELIKGK